jgi:hypothetical protein
MFFNKRLKPLVPVAFGNDTTERNKNYLRNYKITGGDDSLIRAYFLNPFIYEPLSHYFPITMA